MICEMEEISRGRNSGARSQHLLSSDHRRCGSGHCASQAANGEFREIARNHSTSFFTLNEIKSSAAAKVTGVGARLGLSGAPLMSRSQRPPRVAEPIAGLPGPHHFPGILLSLTHCSSSLRFPAVPTVRRRDAPSRPGRPAMSHGVAARTDSYSNVLGALFGDSDGRDGH
jgi:hypothetical protein